jgi:hypothetical protein
MEDQRLSEAFQDLDARYRERYGRSMLEHEYVPLALAPRHTTRRMTAETALILAAALTELKIRLSCGLSNSELHAHTVELWRRAMRHESAVDDLLKRVAKWVPGGVPDSHGATLRDDMETFEIPERDYQP